MCRPDLILKANKFFFIEINLMNDHYSLMTKIESFTENSRYFFISIEIGFITFAYFDG